MKNAWWTLGLVCVALLSGGARGCGGEDVPVGARDDSDGGPGGGLETDAGLARGGDDAGMATEGEVPAGLRGIEIMLSHKPSDVAVDAEELTLSVAFLDGVRAAEMLPAPLERIGECDIRRFGLGTTPVAPGHIDVPAADVRARVDGGRVMSVPATSGSVRSLAIFPVPAAGTRIHVEVDVPGLPRITRDLDTAQVSIASPMLIDVAGPGFTRLDHDRATDLTVTWPAGTVGSGDVVLGAIQPFGTTLMLEGTNTAQCRVPFAARAATISRTVFERYFSGLTLPAGSSPQVVLSNTPVDETVLLPGSDVTVRTQVTSMQHAILNLTSAAP